MREGFFHKYRRPEELRSLSDAPAAHQALRDKPAIVGACSYPGPGRMMHEKMHVASLNHRAVTSQSTL